MSFANKVKAFFTAASIVGTVSAHAADATDYSNIFQNICNAQGEIIGTQRIATPSGCPNYDYIPTNIYDQEGNVIGAYRKKDKGTTTPAAPLTSPR